MEDRLSEMKEFVKYRRGKIPDNIRWIIERAEKAKQVETILCCSDYDNQAKLDNINYLFFNE